MCVCVRTWNYIVRVGCRSECVYDCVCVWLWERDFGFIGYSTHTRKCDTTLGISIGVSDAQAVVANTSYITHWIQIWLCGICKTSARGRCGGVKTAALTLILAAHSWPVKRRHVVVCYCTCGYAFPNGALLSTRQKHTSITSFPISREVTYKFYYDRNASKRRPSQAPDRYGAENLSVIISFRMCNAECVLSQLKRQEHSNSNKGTLFGAAKLGAARFVPPYVLYKTNRSSIARRTNRDRPETRRTRNYAYTKPWIVRVSAFTHLAI